MNPTFSDCAFKLHLPQCMRQNDGLNFSYLFVHNKDNDERPAFYRAELTDRANNHTFCVDRGKLFPLVCAPQSHCVWFPIEKKKQFLSGTKLIMEYLSNSDEKTSVTYILDIHGQSVLHDIQKNRMSDSERSAYADIVLSGITPPPPPPVPAPPPRQGASALEKHLAALRIEKRYLMEGGGKRYKVTNGRLIPSSAEDGFYYLFDLETELHIADDMPIKIETDFKQISGSVLLCEDFQIIVQIEAYLGAKVGSAYIHAEPWKLLEALENRIESMVSMGRSPMADTLWKQGPLLATKDPVSSIPQGQAAVIDRAKAEPITIVWGPPGTGKTHTMAELAIQFLTAGKTVLIVSHSNVSVDGVAKKTDELLRQKGRKDILEAGQVLRYGYVRDEALSKNQYVNSFYYAVSQNPKLKAQLDELQEEYNELKHTCGLGSERVVELRKKIGAIRAQLREQEKNYVSKAALVATTISKVVIDTLFQDKTYDVVMFDEISMAYVLQVVAAATFAKKHLICVGDFMQLAPIAQSKAKDVLSEDVFSFLGINDHGTPHFHPWLVMLNEQRRMHPSISRFANKQVYHGMLRDHPSTLTDKNAIIAGELFRGQPMNLIDLAGTCCVASKNADNSRYNILSALIAFAIAVHTEPNVDTVSIITPYAAQTRLIRALVLDYRSKGETNVRCATVHQFQGSESDVIIFDAVESYPSKKPGWLMGKDFDSIKRLINVAVTRAKGKLITIANSRFWNNNYEHTDHSLYRLLGYLNENGNVVSHAEQKKLDAIIEKLSVMNGPQFFLNQDLFMSIFENDVQSAKKKVIVSLPSALLEQPLEAHVLDLLTAAKNRGVQILVKCNNVDLLPEKWKSFSRKAENAVFPLIIIDDSVTWYGVPTAKWSYRDREIMYSVVCHVVARVKGKHTAEMIQSLSDLEYCEKGLGDFVRESVVCPTCKKPMTLAKGKTGKSFLWCSNCKKTMLLSADVLNHYIGKDRVVCPEHKCGIVAKVGRYGLYIQCDKGHSLKPEDI